MRHKSSKRADDDVWIGDNVDCILAVHACGAVACFGRTSWCAQLDMLVMLLM